jgi:putative ABC transport system permease protein
MGFLWKIAFRNILRNKRRTAITLVAIVLGLSLILIGQGMMDGLQLQSERNLIDYSLGHMKLFPPEYQVGEMLDLEYAIGESQAILDHLNGESWVEGALGQLIFEAGISNGFDYHPVIGVGVDTELLDQGIMLKDALVAGKFLENASGTVMLGSNLAETMGLEVGSDLTLDTRTVDGMRDAQDFTVVGLLRTGNPQVDRMSVYVSLEQVQELLNMPNQVTEILVRLRQGKSQEAAMADISGWLTTTGRLLKVLSWKELSKDFIELHKMKKSGFGVMMAMLVVLTAVGIANTILMATFERVPEIGTMRALGMLGGKIRWMFIFEGLMLGIVGGVVAIVLGGAVNGYLQVHGMNLTAMYGDADIGYPIKDMFYSDLNLASCLSVFVLGVVMAVVASFFPAWRAGKQPVTDAFRHMT